MLRQTAVFLKNPVNYKQGQGMFSHQLKRLLRKNHVHRFTWDKLPMYNPRVLVHANRLVDPETHQIVRDAHWEEQAHWVPDQTYAKIPVPKEFKDAYWWRDLQARRVQAPLEWMRHRFYSPSDKRKYDFQDLSLKKKHRYTLEEVVANARSMRC